MKAITRRSLLFLLIVIASFISVPAFAGVPVVSDIMVTDVTTVSFCVIWASNEACTADLDVFSNPEGTGGSVAGAVITPHPIESGDNSIKVAAETNGVMKVRVTGLEANTTYYFQTITASKSSPDTTYDPSTNPYLPVTTEADTVRAKDVSGDMVPYCNDVIVQACYLADGATAATGTLLLATVKGGDYPVTAFVGDGVVLPYALIDLNNFYSSDTFENLDLLQGENLTLLNFRGIAGNSIITHNVPLDDSLNEIKPGDFGLKAGANFVSFQLEPDDSSTAAALAPIINEASSIWAYDAVQGSWIFYDKNGPPFLNKLNNLNSFTGFWLMMDADASWPINGTFNTNTVSLIPGANLVGYRSIEAVDVLDAISTISAQLESIWTYNIAESKWVFYDANGPPFLNKLQFIEPGRAYWVFVNGNCEW